MESIRRGTGTGVRAPFTRRSLREVLYSATGTIAGVAGFFLVVFTLVPALAVSGSVVGTVAGLLMVVSVLFLARKFGALHRLLLRRGNGERGQAPPPVGAG